MNNLFKNTTIKSQLYTSRTSIFIQARLNYENTNNCQERALKSSRTWTSELACSAICNTIIKVRRTRLIQRIVTLTIKYHKLLSNRFQNNHIQHHREYVCKGVRLMVNEVVEMTAEIKVLGAFFPSIQALVNIIT